MIAFDEMVLSSLGRIGLRALFREFGLFLLKVNVTCKIPGQHALVTVECEFMEGKFATCVDAREFVEGEDLKLNPNLLDDLLAKRLRANASRIQVAEEPVVCVR